MKSYPLQQLARAMHGDLIGGGESLVISSGVSTDTRSIPSGALFFALKGENFDAHDFLAQAIEAGAGALVVEDAQNVPAQFPAIVVGDTLVALQNLARWYLGELDIPVIAITGSNGKTSTKDLTRSVLSQKYRVNATLGNFNNHIGLPLTVLRTEADDELAIFEMGMNHSGELAVLCDIAQPKVSIITNIGTAHIEHLGSREAIAEEKGTVARALGADGTLLVPFDCDFLEKLEASTRATVVATGQGGIRAENIEERADGSEFDLVVEGLGAIRTGIGVAGRHMISNALLAAGAGLIFKLGLEEIAAGLREAVLTSGRLRRFEVDGVNVIDDTYNANPESILAALETLAGLSGEGRRFVVLGMMAELGDHAAEAYPRIGQRASKLGLTLVAVGEAAQAYGAEHFFTTHEEAAEWLAEAAAAGDTVLFKGSRMSAMERVMTLAFPESN